MKTHKFWLGLFAISFGLAGAGCGNPGSETTPADAGADGPTVILDGGGPVAVPPDGASACPQGACNYQTNAGCAANQTCVPLPDGSGKVPPGCIGAGDGKSGVACENFDQCAPGYICVAKACRKLCCGGDWSGCPSDAEHCIQGVLTKDASGNSIATGAMVCLPVNTCDALNPAVCPTPGQTCQIVDPTGATVCLPEGKGGAGEGCPCKGGSLCVTEQIDGKPVNKCHRLCKAVEGGGEPSCQAGEGICVHFNRDPAGVGECTPTSSGK